MMLPEVREQFLKTPGWFEQPEADVLDACLRESVHYPGRVVEVGSWKGRSSAVIAGTIRELDLSPAVCVDTWFGGDEFTGAGVLPEFKQNLGALLPYVEPWQTTSLEAAAQFQEAVSFLFIDASHRYEDVRSDVQAWIPKLSICPISWLTTRSVKFVMPLLTRRFAGASVGYSYKNGAVC